MSWAGTPTRFRDVIPPVMLLYVVLTIVTSLGERAIYFSPSDVDFLFPAPFSRRQLLLYKILGSVTRRRSSVACSSRRRSSCTSVRGPRPWSASSWPGSWSTASRSAPALAQGITERAFTRARRLAPGRIDRGCRRGAGPGGEPGARWPVAGHVAARHGTRPSPKSSWRPSRCSPASSPPSDWSPTRWAGPHWPRSWSSPSMRWPSGWTPITWRPPSASAGRCRSDSRRAMTGGCLCHAIQERVRSSRLPQPPWRGGVGPLVWRQASRPRVAAAGRCSGWPSSRWPSAPPLRLGHRGHGMQLPTLLPHMVIGIAAYTTFLFSAQAPLGFRGDYECMELLKSLPIRPLAMACGQTVVAVLLLTLLEGLAFRRHRRSRARRRGSSCSWPACLPCPSTGSSSARRISSSCSIPRR